MIKVMRRYPSYNPFEYEEDTMLQLRVAYVPTAHRLKAFVVGMIVGFGFAYFQMGITCLITHRL
jgi:hypothetical protein